jgi:DNA-binding CsgD family transcriptional regulator
VDGEATESPPPSPDPAEALVQARKAIDREDFRTARQLFSWLADLDAPGIRFRARAYLGYLDYYRGSFEKGLERTLAIPGDAPRLARAEAALYASVNLTGLDRIREALRYAVAARNLARRVPEKSERTDLCFRCHRQLVHILVAHGDYTTAFAEARSAQDLARRTNDPRLRAVAAYLLGLVEAATGDPAAVIHFREADLIWGGRTHAFGQWIKYFWAMALRDAGDPQDADRIRAASGVSLRWDEPLFELALGRQPKYLEIDGSPADQVPLRHATNGLIALVAHAPDRAVADLTLAMEELTRLELFHYARGAAMNLAAAHLALGDRRSATELVSAHLGTFERLHVTRWPWWHPPTVRRVLAYAETLGIHTSFASFIALSMRVPEPDTETILRVRDLTGRETKVVLAWLSAPSSTRRELAERLGMSEATVRNHLNAVRRKLGCDERRGLAGIRSRLAQAVGSSK